MNYKFLIERMAVNIEAAQAMAETEESALDAQLQSIGEKLGEMTALKLLTNMYPELCDTDKDVIRILNAKCECITAWSAPEEDYCDVTWKTPSGVQVTWRTFLNHPIEVCINGETLNLTPDDIIVNNDNLTLKCGDAEVVI